VACIVLAAVAVEPLARRRPSAPSIDAGPTG
jgi:hypothetical protein